MRQNAAKHAAASSTYMTEPEEKAANRPAQQPGA
jgi:hypothetical protein